MPKLVNAQELPTPKPTAIKFDDPRPSRPDAEVGIIGFCHLGKDEGIDKISGANFLSNWFDISPNRIELTAPAEPEVMHTFGNAETAFHALKFWRVADTFVNSPAKDSWNKYRKLTGKEDITYANYGSNWKAMKAVLTAKFAADPRLAAKLRETGDTFLVHHVPDVGRDPVWSDNGDGTGQNWLGIMLMLVRDSFSGRDVWTEWFQTLMNVETGQMRGMARSRKLQDTIIKATIAVLDTLENEVFGSEAEKPICKRPGCGRPTWNGFPDEYCDGNCRFLAEDDNLLRQAAEAEAEAEAQQPGQLALPASTPSSKQLAIPNHAGTTVFGTKSSEKDKMLAFTNVASKNSDGVFHTTTLMTMDRDMQQMRVTRGSVISNELQRTSEFMPEAADPDKVDVNRPGILPTLIFICIWVGSVVAVLVAIIWVYVYQEVRRHEDLATAAAVAHARFLAAQVLQSSESVVRAVAVGFGGGAVGSLADYGSLERVLEPHFGAQQALLHEVELAGPPEEALGSIHVSAASWTRSGVLLRTDRPDCERVEGKLGCTLEDMHANLTSWYTTGFGVGYAWHQTAPTAFWHGPTYALNNPLEVVCEEFCWRATYGYVGRVVGGPHSPQGTSLQSGVATTSTTAMPSAAAPSGAPPQVLVRAALDAHALKEVVTKAEAVSRGEATVCTSSGDILASRDLAETIFVERSTGNVRPRLMWELQRKWATLITPEFVDKAKEHMTFTHNGHRVSAWPLSGGQLNLASDLRIILAVPEEGFYDEVLGPLIPLATGTAAFPLAGLTVVTVIVLLLRCLMSLYRRHQTAIMMSAA